MEVAIAKIQAELEGLKVLKRGKLLKPSAWNNGPKYDIEMLQEMGHTNGVKNYSPSHGWTGEGEPPYTFLTSSQGFSSWCLMKAMTVQIKGMYNGDRSRKEMLVNYGFRLLIWVLDNRPLRREEFESHVH